MKQILSLALMLMVSLTAMAQYNTSKTHFTVKVRSFPAYYVPEQDRTYGVRCNFSKAIKEYYPQEEFASRINFEDYDYMDEIDDANVKIIVDALDFIVEGMHEVEQKVIVKKNGETHEHIVFAPQIDYSIVLKWRMESPQGVTTYTNLDPYTHRPPISSFQIDKTFHSPRDCHEFMRDNKGVFFEKILTTELDAMANAIYEEMVVKYRYGVTDAYIPMYFLDNKKSPYYEKHKAAKQEISRLMHAIPLEGPLTQSIKDFQPWINHFKEIAESLSESDKKQKNAKAEMLYNIAMIYYVLEIYDVSKEYGMDLFNKYGEGSGKRLVRDICSIEDDLKKHHLTTRHF